jgi:hypothetical protein
LGPDQIAGGEVRFFWLDKRTTTFNATTGNSVDQFLINTGFTQNLFLISGSTRMTTTTLQNSFPLFFVRQATSTLVGSHGTGMWGGELNARSNCLFFGGMRVGGLVGFRYLNFHEDLNIVNNVRLFRPSGFPLTAADANGSLPPDLSFTTADTVLTHNNYYGGQIGAELEACCKGFFAAARTTVGVGAVHETVNIDSNTTGLTGTVPGGLLASPLDLGKHSRDRIAWRSEVNVKLGYNFTNWLCAYVGYDWVYLSNVARPGDQTDIATLNTTIRVANSTNQISVAQPTFRFHDTSTFANGLSFGLELRY